MRFLIDECLSIDLVLAASLAGHEAQHVAHVGKAGWKDWNVLRHSAEGDLEVDIDGQDVTFNLYELPSGTKR